MKQFFSLAEILAARSPDLPTTERSLYRLAEREGWRHREGLARAASRRGGGWEYHIDLLPPSAQARLTVIHGTPANDDRRPEEDRRKALWARFETLSSDQKAACEERLEVVRAVEAGRKAGLTERAAVASAAAQAKVSVRTVHSWRAMIAGVDRADWLAALAPAYRASVQRADCHEQAWAVFKSDYLRPEAPTLTSCYRRMKAAAREHGWQPIPSERALRRRLEAEVPRAVQVLAREGRDTAKTLYPAQRRTRAHLHAMQAVNMDGHKLDVFVRLSGDRIGRVHLLALQDLYSGKIVAWRLAESENKETVRLVIGDMVERYGIPDAIWLDNGRAFASKWITGGAPNRYRFKVRDEDPRGLITALGIEIHWTTPYSGQSKPIERAFRDLTDAIARHPFCSGAYTGNTPEAKPENYGARAVPFAAFRELVAAEIAEHNARPGRKTPTVNGRSFDEAFSESLKDAGSIVRWPTKAQRSLWLLAAERIRTRKGSGEIHLFGNRYWHRALNALAGRFVTIRFDPDDLALPLKVYDERDTLICEAERIADTGFDDAAAAREHAARRNALLKATREQQRLHAELSAEALADIYGAPSAPPEPEIEEPAVKRIATAGARPRPGWGDEHEEALSRALGNLSNVVEFAPAHAGERSGPERIECGSKKRSG